MSVTDICAASPAHRAIEGTAMDQDILAGVIVLALIGLGLIRRWKQ
jgi:hypothetical protein